MDETMITIPKDANLREALKIVEPAANKDEKVLRRVLEWAIHCVARVLPKCQSEKAYLALVAARQYLDGEITHGKLQVIATAAQKYDSYCGRRYRSHCLSPT